MPLSLNLDVRWAQRPESAEACARHLQEMLVRLAIIHPIFGRWREQAETEEEAQNPFCAMPPDITEMRSIVEANIMRDDSNRPWPELGYALSAWNAIDSTHSLSLRVHAGAWNDNVLDPNGIRCQLGNATPENRDFLHYQVLKEVLIAVGQSWNADWGIIGPFAFRRPPKDAEVNYGRPRPGWLTYLSPKNAGLVTPPSAAITESLADGALLIAVTKDQFDPDDRSQMALYDAVQASMGPLQK
jgi:hypothetical protein